MSERSFWGDAVDIVGGVGSVWYGLAAGVVRSVVTGEKYLDAAQNEMGRVYDRVIDAADYADKHKDELNHAAKRAAARVAGDATGKAAAKMIDRD